MFHPHTTIHTRILRALAAAVIASPTTYAADVPVSSAIDESLPAAYDAVQLRNPETGTPTEWHLALAFTTVEDAEAFGRLADNIHGLVPPDPRLVAREFIREKFGVEGDDYVVAHFRTAKDRAEGKPDHQASLTEALMEAFPDHSRHTTFALLSDFIGGLSSGGSESPSIVATAEHVWKARDLKGILMAAGKLAWSRTGPGYVYNTLFNSGSVIDVAVEDYRDIDEAFGVYSRGGFDKAHESALRLSKLVEQLKQPGLFSQIPYVKELDDQLSAYWRGNHADWVLMARYQFILRARVAFLSGVLNRDQFERVMRGGAQGVPFEGPVSLAQLRNASRDDTVDIRRFDINGYTATNLVRFVAPDKSEVMYMPGQNPAFVVSRDESALHEWVREQAKVPEGLEALLSHFSDYDNQDGVFWTGVKNGLEYIGSGRWSADDKTINHENARIFGDVFADMQFMTMRRMRSDARLQVSTAWEAWRLTINRTAAVLSPLGFFRPLAVPVQAAVGVAQTGTGVEQWWHGRTEEERRNGLAQVGLAVASTGLMGTVFGRYGEGAATRPAEPGEVVAQPDLRHYAVPDADIASMHSPSQDLFRDESGQEYVRIAGNFYRSRVIVKPGGQKERVIYDASRAGQALRAIRFTDGAWATLPEARPSGGAPVLLSERLRWGEGILKGIENPGRGPIYARAGDEWVELKFDLSNCRWWNASYAHYVEFDEGAGIWREAASGSVRRTASDAERVNALKQLGVEWNPAVWPPIPTAVRTSIPKEVTQIWLGDANRLRQAKVGVPGIGRTLAQNVAANASVARGARFTSKLYVLLDVGFGQEAAEVSGAAMTEAQASETQAIEALRADLPGVEIVNLRTSKLFRDFKGTPYHEVFEFFRRLGPDRNLAAASDVLRAYLLHRKGGLYLDVDDQLRPGFRLSDLKAAVGEVLTEGPVSQQQLGMDTEFNTNALASLPGNEFFKRYLEVQLARFAMNRENFKNRPYFGRGNDERFNAYMRLISKTVGPGAFNDIVKERLPVKAAYLDAWRALRAVHDNQHIINAPPIELSRFQQAQRSFAALQAYVNGGNYHSWHTTQ